MPEATVEILESRLGTAPRKVGTKALGDGRLRIRTHHAVVEMAVSVEVERIEEDVLHVSLSDFEGLDFPELGLNPAFAELTVRFGVEFLENSGAIRLSLVLRRVPVDQHCPGRLASEVIRRASRVARRNGSFAPAAPPRPRRCQVSSSGWTSSPVVPGPRSTHSVRPR